MTWGKPGWTGVQTATWSCTAPDGATVTATLDYDAGSGAPSGLTVTNTSSRATALVLTVNGTPTSVRVPAGSTTLTAQQIAKQGLTDVNTQLTSVTLTAP